MSLTDMVQLDLLANQSVGIRIENIVSNIALLASIILRRFKMGF